MWYRSLMIVALFYIVAPAQKVTETPPANGAGQASELPPAATHYKGRRIARTMHYSGAPWLVRESREREEECSKLLAALDLQPGQVACDIGCGNGFYTLRLARTVGPRGKVYGVDIQQEMIDMLTERAEARGVTNIEPVLGTAVDPRLPSGAVDLILAVDVYHEFSHPEDMLRAIRASLKPTGRLVLVEFRSEDPDVPIKRLHKMSQQQVMREVPPNGFKLVGQFDDLPWQHVLFFGRDDGPLPEIELEPWVDRKSEAAAEANSQEAESAVESRASSPKSDPSQEAQDR